MRADRLRLRGVRLDRAEARDEVPVPDAYGTPEPQHHVQDPALSVGERHQELAAEATAQAAEWLVPNLDAGRGFGRKRRAGARPATGNPPAALNHQEEVEEETRCAIESGQPEPQ